MSRLIGTLAILFSLHSTGAFAALTCPDLFSDGPPYGHGKSSVSRPKDVFGEIASKTLMQEGDVTGFTRSLLGNEIDLEQVAGKILSSEEAYDTAVELFVTIRIYMKSVQGHGTDIDPFFMLLRFIGRSAEKINKKLPSSGVNHDFFLSRFDENSSTDFAQKVNSGLAFVNNQIMAATEFKRILKDDYLLTWDDIHKLQQRIEDDLRYLQSIDNPNRTTEEIIEEYQFVAGLVRRQISSALGFGDLFVTASLLYAPADYSHRESRHLALRTVEYNAIQKLVVRLKELTGI